MLQREHLKIKKLFEFLGAAALFLFVGFGHAADKTWASTGTAGNWSDGTNWVGGAPPVSGDRLLFPSGLGGGSTNDLAGASFEAIVVSGLRIHTFRGLRINLTGDAPLTIVSPASVQIATEMRFASPQALIDLQPGPPTDYAYLTLEYGGRMTFAGGRPSIRSTGYVQLNGSLAQESPTTLVLSGDKSITLAGTSSLSAIESTVRTFVADSNSALGPTGATAIITAGTLWIGGIYSSAWTLPSSLDFRAPEDTSFGNLYAQSFSAQIQMRGPITISGAQRFRIASQGADFRGPISGSGRLKLLVAEGSYYATLFNPANSFTGGVQVLGGRLRAGASEVLPDAGDLQIDPSGWFILRDYTETVRSLNCSSGTLEITPGVGLLRVLQPGSMLSNCRLSFSPSGVTPLQDGEITIIRNQSGVPIDGAFQGQAEGDGYVLNGVSMHFTYRGGGSGYDVALSSKRIEPPPPPATRSVRMNAPDGQPITLSAFTTESACVISRAQIIDPRVALLPAPMPTGVAFPRGLLDFRVDNCGVNQPVAFIVEFTDPLPPTATYWKYGPTPDNRTAHWYPMPGRIDGNRFTFTITDGGLGDDDLAANGSITDMGGLAFNGGALQDLWWSGTAENGWGMSIIQHGDMLFANVYVYDTAGRPMWLVIPGGAWNAPHTAFTGALYIPHGSPYFAYDVSRFNIGTAVGSATFTFSGENSAVFDYTINGVSGRKNITRLAFGRPETLAAPALGDLWWGGQAQNGWGITVLQQLRTLFSLWYTYDANGEPTWYVMPGGEWTAGDTYEGRIYRAVGSAWVGATYDASQHRTIDVGSFRLRFTGDNATLEYSIEGRSGTVPLTRLAF